MPIALRENVVDGLNDIELLVSEAKFDVLALYKIYAIQKEMNYSTTCINYSRYIFESIILYNTISIFRYKISISGHHFFFFFKITRFQKLAWACWSSLDLSANLC
jgi:hypothetical protein